ncbi:MAG: hypothetical protein WCA04_03895 [Geobacteraceae bacterium]
MTDESDQNTNKKACERCRNETQFLYWCEVCEKAVEEKRCPSCGLKTRKIR